MFAPCSVVYCFVYLLSCFAETADCYTLSSWCLLIVIFLCPFVTVPVVGLQCVIVLFPGHTHLLFVRLNDDPGIKLSSVGWCLSMAGPTVAQLKGFFSSDYP